MIIKIARNVGLKLEREPDNPICLLHVVVHIVGHAEFSSVTVHNDVRARQYYQEIAMAGLLIDCNTCRM